MTNELPTYPSEDVAGFRKAVVALARMGVVPYIDRLFVFGAQEYEPDETPYTGETPFSLRLAMDLFAVTCDRWAAPIFGAPLDESDRCVRIMNKKGRLVCHCN